jgi:hypothetical protein
MAEPSPEAVAHAAARLSRRYQDSAEQDLHWVLRDREAMRVLLQFVALVIDQTGYSRRVDAE